MNYRIEDRGNGTKWVEVNGREMIKISKWCRETGCGKQVNYKQISFKSDQELSMFLLKWQIQNENTNVR